jgi:hypothetical protein
VPGVLAAAETARAAPDVHTLMLGASTQLSIASHTHKKLAYNPARDFAAVSQVVSTDFVLLVNPQKVQARNLKEFAAVAKAQPKGLFMGTFGAGTLGHFGAYVLCDAIQVKPEALHYKNTGDVLTGLEFSSWFGIVVPARTPPELVQDHPQRHHGMGQGGCRQRVRGGRASYGCRARREAALQSRLAADSCCATKSRNRRVLRGSPVRDSISATTGIGRLLQAGSNCTRAPLTT